MPIRIRKLPGKKRYQVKEGGRVTAHSTTKGKAEAQRRLLRGVASGWVPGRSKTKTSGAHKRTGRR